MRPPPLRPWLVFPLVAAPLIVGCAMAAKSGSLTPPAAPTDSMDATGEPMLESTESPAEAPAPLPGGDAELEVTSLAEAERLLAEAIATLDGASELDVTMSPPPPSTGAGGAVAETAPKRAAARSAPPPASSVPNCSTACRAMDSLRRAAAAICRLTSEADPRCIDARATVTHQSRRVASCGCAEPSE